MSYFFDLNPGITMFWKFVIKDYAVGSENCKICNDKQGTLGHITARNVGLSWTEYTNWRKKHFIKKWQLSVAFQYCRYFRFNCLLNAIRLK